MFNDFKEFHSRNECYLCSMKYIDVNLQSPCLHWLLRPQNICKKDVVSVFDCYGFERSIIFLRWLANTVTPYGININDLLDEGDTSKLIDLTIRYKNFEWSFSCGVNDFKGHENAIKGNLPHFHFQMKIDDKPFIDFGDFHISFTKNDLQYLTLKHFPYSDGYGIGMQEIVQNLLSKDNPISELQTSDVGQFNVSTIITPKSNDDLISGKEIKKILDRAKAEGKTFSKVVSESNLNYKIIISPSDNVVTKSSRKKSR